MTFKLHSSVNVFWCAEQNPVCDDVPLENLNLPTIFLQTECPEMKMSLHLYHLSAWQFSLVWFNLIIWLIFQIISKCHYTFNIDKSLKFCFGNWPLGGQLLSYYTKSTVIYGLSIDYSVIKSISENIVNKKT